jgi:thiamine-monophosphate kinase
LIKHEKFIQSTYPVKDMACVSEIGERGLIEIMSKYFKQMPNMVLPFWDDASGLKIYNEKVLVINTDMLVWKTDVPLGMTAYQAARKNVIMTISDLGAKGVKPMGYMPSLAFPKEQLIFEAEEMARGFQAGVSEYGTYILGGDTNEADEVIINGTAFGIADENVIMRRGGAQVGDILATTGTFGMTTAAFRILLDDYHTPTKLKNSLVESVFMPKARVREGVILAESGAVTSCIDSSDGLSISLYDLQKSTGLGYKITNLPTSKEVIEFATLHEIDVFDLVFFGGEEYELVFTLKSEFVNIAKDALKKIGCKLHIIGEVIKDKRIWIEMEEHCRDIPMKGWDHFT